MRVVPLMILGAALTACGTDGSTVVDPPKTLPAGVHALTGIAPTLPHTDLEPLREIVGDARFVALGESTHTSRGFYQAKFRLIRFMVEQMGFRVLMFESPWQEALPATEYVASCAGTPEAALASLNGVWRDVSVRDMLRWLCDYNRANPGDPVTFFGFDIQEPWRSAPALRDFIEAAAPAEIALAQPLFQCLGATHSSGAAFFGSPEFQNHVSGQRDHARHVDCLTGISALEAWIAQHAVALEATTSPAAVEEARIALIALRAWEQQLWVPDPGGYQARDHGMAQTILRLHALHTPAQKTIVWAWNWHIARRYEEVRGFNDDPDMVVPRQGARAMGSFLHDALGSAYLPIALIGYNVEMIAGATAPPVPTHALSVERRLHELQQEYLLVDLGRTLPDSLLPRGPTYQISQEWGDPYRQFGALLFLDHSPAMVYFSAAGTSP